MNIPTCTSHAPWKTEFGLYGWVILSNRGEEVAFIRQSIVHDEANARLIASAPELLEALESVLFSAEAMRDELESFQGFSGEPESMKAARAAVAKARGEKGGAL